MNIKEVFKDQKNVAAKPIFKGEKGEAMAIQILEGHLLKKHITKTPAFLICISGKVTFNYEKGGKYILQPGDFLRIEPMEEHWVKGENDSRLLLVK